MTHSTHWPSVRYLPTGMSQCRTFYKKVERSYRYLLWLQTINVQSFKHANDPSKYGNSNSTTIEAAPTKNNFIRFSFSNSVNYVSRANYHHRFNNGVRPSMVPDGTVNPTWTLRSCNSINRHTRTICITTAKVL